MSGVDWRVVYLVVVGECGSFVVIGGVGVCWPFMSGVFGGDWLVG